MKVEAKVACSRRISQQHAFHARDATTFADICAVVRFSRLTIRVPQVAKVVALMVVDSCRPSNKPDLKLHARTAPTGRVRTENCRISNYRFT